MGRLDVHLVNSRQMLLFFFRGGEKNLVNLFQLVEESTKCVFLLGGLLTIICFLQGIGVEQINICSKKLVTGDSQTHKP